MSDSFCKDSTDANENREFEMVKIAKVKQSCATCENYATAQATKEVAVLSCEGACLRGEVARQAANILCHNLARQTTVRICLGGAFTKNAGQRNLVRQARRILAVEGCFLKCASRMMKGVLPETAIDVVVADTLYDVDGKIFGVDEVAPEQVVQHARTVAEELAKALD